MITVKIYRSGNKEICGFKLSGHAGYAEEGQDIVCAAVTMLVLNTVNAIECFTDTVFDCEVDEVNGGYIFVQFPDIQKGKQLQDTQLLLKTMVLGLENVKKEYSKYIILNNEEV